MDHPLHYDSLNGLRLRQYELVVINILLSYTFRCRVRPGSGDHASTEHTSQVYQPFRLGY